MNREILFRGKRVDTGKFVEGYYVKDCDHKHYIFDKEYSFYSKHVVIPETVCQFTGLLDKNGRKIWEGDICEIKTKYGFHSELLNEFKNEKDLKSINDIGSHFTGIIRVDLLRGLMFENPKNGYAEPMFNRLRKISAYYEISDIEVIGSIHDKEGC